LALSAIREQPAGFLERQPAHLCNLDLLLRRDCSEPALPVPEEEEADDLEDSLAGPRVDVADIAELLDELGLDACLLTDLAECGLLGLLTEADQPFGKRPDAR